MQLLAISLARLIALTDIYEWSPRNIIPEFEFARAFIERYGFLKGPQTLEEFDLEKGVVFHAGRVGSINIVGATFFRNGIVIDTRSSTEDAENVLSDMAEWAEHFFGLEHSPSRIRRKVFLSELTFYSEASLDFLNPKLKKLVARLNEVVSSYVGEPQHFEFFSLNFKDDPPGRLGLQTLRIERLPPFWENKYFSSAPLPTDAHLGLLEDFESILLG